MAPQSCEQSNVFEKDGKYKRVASPQVPGKTAFCELTPVKWPVQMAPLFRITPGSRQNRKLRISGSGCRTLAPREHSA